MKALVRAFAVLALVSSAGICFFFFPCGFDADLHSLSGGNSVLTELSRSVASKIRVLADTPEAAERCRRVAAFDPPLSDAEMLKTIRGKGRGLLSWKTRRLLSEGRKDVVLRSVQRRDYSGTGMFPKSEDPFYFLNDFVTELMRFRPPELNGKTLLAGDSRNIAKGGLDALIALAREDDGIALSGAPFHVQMATESSKREINLLGSVSLAAVLLFGFLLFRRMDFVFPVSGALLAGFIAGTAAIMLLPGKPHVLTLLFGTSLLGLGVDYCYHSLNGVSVRKLAVAFITTSLTFVPLAFSGVAVLEQMAVFTVAGLTMIFSATSFFPVRQPAPRSGPAASIGEKASMAVRIAVFVVAAGGLAFVEYGNGVSRFHRMDPLMRAGEAKVAAAAGAGASKFILLPLKTWQEENAALKAGLGPVSGEFLGPGDLPSAMTVSLQGVDYLVLPDVGLDRVPVKGEIVLEPKTELEKMFDGYARRSRPLLACSFAALLLVSLVVFRRRFLIYVLPVVAACFATAGVLGYIGEQIGFFQWLCFFIIVGLGVDYAVFNLDPDADENGRRTVKYGFLTSAVGFGMLALTSFQVTRSMGITLACGLGFAYLFSLGGRPRGPDRGSGKWNELREQSAGKLRILFMWWVYRLFGKSFAKIMFVPVAAFICLFARSARGALKEFRRVTGLDAPSFPVMLNFAWSIFDKTDACTLKKNLPRMTLAGDRGWMDGGCFLVSTHVGCIEVMPALRQTLSAGDAPVVHAFQQLGHNAVFTSHFLKNVDNSQLTLHAVEDIGVETAVEMKSAVDRGEIVLMAGDRPSAGSKAVLKREFFSRECVWPKGVFTFARLLGCPVYAIACVRTGWNAYEVRAERLNGDVPGAYVRFLECLTREFPRQWYNFYRFFDNASGTA